MSSSVLSRVVRRGSWLLPFALLASCGSSVMSPTGAGGTQGGTGSGGSNQPCQPTLNVPWQIVDNLTNVSITCVAAGAVGVELDVNGAGVAPVPYVINCAESQSSGEFSVVLGKAATYTLDIFLIDAGNAVLSEAHPPSIAVDCPGFTTQTVVLPVNE